MNRERKHARLRNFDYSSEGAYYITFNVKYRRQIFGHIADEIMHLSEIGKIAEARILAIPEHFPSAVLDEYVIMPDHIHCIIFLTTASHGLEKELKIVPPLRPVKKSKINHEADLDEVTLRPSVRTIACDGPTLQSNQFSKPVKGSISVIIQQFKAAVTTECKKRGLRITWQGRFHDHVIRSEAEYQRIKKYIRDNVKNWRKRSKGHHK